MPEADESSRNESAAESAELGAGAETETPTPAHAASPEAPSSTPTPHSAAELQTFLALDKASYPPPGPGQESTQSQGFSPPESAGWPVLPGYEILGQLGRGGMGVVYKARQLKVNRIVALKLIRASEDAGPELQARFRREALAAARVTHANIVALYDVDQWGDHEFLVMEFVDGIDLARLTKQAGPLPIHQACDFIRQASLGLQHAHERGLVHRDIKPANLILSSEGNVIKVLDLGLARLIRPLEEGQPSSVLTHEGMMMGTPDFMAPEQALDPHEVDIRADIYSLGCTLYYLLTVQPPFTGGTYAQKLMQQQQSELPVAHKLRPELPRDIARVIQKMMAKQPSERYQTPAEVAKALEPFSQASPAETGLTERRRWRPPPIPAQTATRKLRWLIPLLSLPVLLIGLWFLGWRYELRTVVPDAPELVRDNWLPLAGLIVYNAVWLTRSVWRRVRHRAAPFLRIIWHRLGLRIGFGTILLLINLCVLVFGLLLYLVTLIGPK